MKPPALQRIEYLRSAMEEAIDRGLLTEIEPPVEHYHADGVYGRRIFVPGGITVITKVHMTQHITVALKGTCTVYGEDGSRKVVTAPAVFVTEPGTQRAIYCHDEVEWITVHASDTAEVPAIEQAIFSDNYDEYDYRQFLLEHDISENIARIISENEDDQTHETEADVEIKGSALEGQGCFARRSFQVGELIGMVRTDGGLRTLIGRYTNHSGDPNIQFVPRFAGIDAYALRDIESGEELTVNYREAVMVSNQLRYLS